METFNYTTSCKTILADLYTPVGVYMRLRDIYPQSALMESSDYHDKDNARSFIGINPIASVAIGHGEATIIFPDGSHEEHSISTDYGTADAIHALIDRIHVEEITQHSAVCTAIPHSMLYAILNISLSKTRHRRKTMLLICSIYYIRISSSSTTLTVS